MGVNESLLNKLLALLAAQQAEHYGRMPRESFKTIQRESRKWITKDLQDPFAFLSPQI